MNGKTADIDHRETGLLTALAPVAALLCSTAILLMGNGLQGTLVPVRANLESFSPSSLGIMGAAYFLGFTAGCIHGPSLVHRSGHIRAYLAMTSIASTITLLHVIYIDAAVWWVLRVLSGYCFALLYVVVESWLNAMANNRTRGTVFAIYTMINLASIAAGQLMLTIANPAEFTLFAVTSVLISLAAIPVAFTAAASPQIGDFVRPNIAKLYRISPAGVAGCVAVGLTNGSFWSLGPVYAQNVGLDTKGIAFFMSAVVLGGAIVQWPLGRLSDSMDRRLVMIGAALVALLAALDIAISSQDLNRLIVAGMLFGAGAFPLYTLAVAHANDYADHSKIVEVSSGLLLVFSASSIAGPLLAAISREYTNAPTLFYFTAAVHAVFICYLVWRITQRHRAPAEEREAFAQSAIAAQTVLPIDPNPDDPMTQPPAAPTPQW